MVHRVVIKAIIKNIVVVGGRDDIKLARNLRNSIKSAVFTRGAVETIRGNRAVWSGDILSVLVRVSSKKNIIHSFHVNRSTMAFKKRGKEQYTEKTASLELIIEIAHNIPALSDQCLIDITGVSLSTVFQSSKRVGSSITVACHESADTIISDLLLQIGNAKRRIN